MARTIFIDTGAWLALADVDDPFHTDAVAFYDRDLRQRSHFVTTNLVCAEAYTLIPRRSGHSAAMSFLAVIRDSTLLEKVYADAALEAQAAVILGRYNDQNFSYVDAT